MDSEPNMKIIESWKITCNGCNTSIECKGVFIEQEIEQIEKIFRQIHDVRKFVKVKRK